MNIGVNNQLKLVRFTDNGAYLEDDNQEEVLLPNKYVSEDVLIGDVLDVFIYTDSQDRLVATNLTPLVKDKEFACLRVKEVNNIGAFMDWGLEKDLLVPYSEQKSRLRPGQWILVYSYLDNITKRMTASTKIYQFLSEDLSELEEGQEVDIVVGETSINGINTVINNKFSGLLYQNEVFEELLKGSKRKAYVKKIRVDHKVDLSLHKVGVEQLEEGASKIMKHLELNNGILPLGDKSAPEEIQMVLQMSKKNFKKSVGILYKQKKIMVDKTEIKLN
ncbi:MAG: S1-like domain-containing RNA-binding protein [Reichenbachiella sp.]